MRRYFDSDVDSAGQRIFVLYGLGGAGKSQLAFKFIEESEGKRYASRLNKIKYNPEGFFLAGSLTYSTLTPRVKRLFERI